MSKSENGEEDTVLGVEGLIEREQLDEDEPDEAPEPAEVEVEEPAVEEVDSAEGMPGTSAADPLDLDEPDDTEEVEPIEEADDQEESDDLRLTMIESLQLVAPYALLAVGAVLAGAGYLDPSIPTNWSYAPLVFSGLGLLQIVRKEAEDTETHHHDERACMLPECVGTIEAIGSDGTVLDEPTCRSCGTRYDFEVGMTDPQAYLDTVREGSSGTPTEALADADDEPEEDEDERTLPKIAGWNDE